MYIIYLLFKLFMRKILSLSVTYVQILPLSSNGRKEIMEALEEFKLFIGKNEINQLFEFIEKVDEPHYKQLPK